MKMRMSVFYKSFAQNCVIMVDWNITKVWYTIVENVAEWAWNMVVDGIDAKYLKWSGERECRPLLDGESIDFVWKVSVLRWDLASRKTLPINAHHFPRIIFSENSRMWYSRLKLSELPRQIFGHDSRFLLNPWFRRDVMTNFLRYFGSVDFVQSCPSMQVFQPITSKVSHANSIKGADFPSSVIRLTGSDQFTSWTWSGESIVEMTSWRYHGYAVTRRTRCCHLCVDCQAKRLGSWFWGSFDVVGCCVVLLRSNHVCLCYIYQSSCEYVTLRIKIIL